MNYERKQEVNLMKSHSAGPTIEQMKYQAYFHKAGAGIQSAEVAAAIMQSKRKKLTAAICMIESQGIKNAYNKKSKAKGMYQVMERHWGAVNTKSALAMTAQHDQIMDELLADCDGDLKKALNNYGGDSKRKVYAKNILAELEQFEK